MASFDLPAGQKPPIESSAKKVIGFLPAELLVDNVFWFCRLRWIVIAFLCVTEALAAGGRDFFASHAIYLSSRWPVLCSAVLTVTNILFLLHGRRLRKSPDFKAARTNLILQSVSDLIVLTAVIYFVGSVETFVPFAYLFHVVLACIFFPRRLSLGVTLLSCLLYSACVTLEHIGIFPTDGVFGGLSVGDGFRAHVTPLVLHVSSAMAVWLVVWYLVSHLSAAVRQRDRELTEANERLTRMENEKAMHMLRTTHELKAPFAAIQSNVQLLQKGYCGHIAKDVADVLDRIDTRCLKLSTLITEMLQLADLRSLPVSGAQNEQIRLDRLIRSVAENFRVPASARGIEIKEHLRPATTVGVMGHLGMMLANIISNAVVYSKQGGRVWLTCEPQQTGEVVVTVKDHGIGIPQRSLPHIFQEYYRSNKAAQYNKMSTGLGLAIVKHIAQSHSVAIHVDSEEGKGTTFRLTFPAQRTGGVNMSRIMIVDDDADFTEAAKRVLQTDRHEVQVLTYIENAMDTLEKDPPDCLILDVMFPEDATAGFDLAREIRRHDKLARLPVLILSAVNTKFPLGFGPHDIDNHWLPVQDFLEKPVDFDVLKQKVRQLCEEGKRPSGDVP